MQHCSGKGPSQCQVFSQEDQNQILDVADPRKLIKRGYQNACDYFDIMEKRILIQQRALACLSKSSSYPPEGTLHYGQHRPSTKRGRNDPPSSPSGGIETSGVEELTLLAFSLQVSTGKRWRGLPPKKGTGKNSQGFEPYQNKPFRGPHHNKKRGSYRKRPYGGNSSHSSNQWFSSIRRKPNFRGSRPHNRGRGRGNPSSQ